MSVNSDLDARKQQLQAEKAAYYERINNFKNLRSGLIEKYVEGNLDLKDRQQESIFKITDASEGDYTYSSGYFSACTAFGKTYLMMAMAEGYRAEEKDKKIVILEENVDVLEQVAEDFVARTSFGENDIGVFYNIDKMTQTPIIISTYRSMEKMLKTVGKENIGLVLCDEAHHGLSAKRKEFIRNSFNGACLYGFTGTPDYNARKTCKELFETEIDRVDIKEGVSKELLCSVKNGLMISRIPVDLSGIKDTSGDYDDKKLMQAIDKASHEKGIRESLAEYYLHGEDEDIGVINGKITLINVPNMEEADKLAEVFNQKAGKTIAKAYHTKSGDRPLKEFNDGEFPVLIQVNRLSEGYNNPEVSVCINYPTASLVRETQCSGRALRYNEQRQDKMALILDIAFKKGNGQDIYEQIADNGQVLFKDIANDVCILGPGRQQIAKQNSDDNLPQNKPKIDDDMLFDVVTDYEDLFRLAIAHEAHFEDTSFPEKQPNDIGYSDFIRDYQVSDIKGKNLPLRQRVRAFEKIVKDKKLFEQGVMAYRRGRTGVVSCVIIGDRLAEFNQISGYIISEKIASNDNTPDRKHNDIGYNDFISNYKVCDTNGKDLTYNQKMAIFNKITADKKLLEKGVVAYRKSSAGFINPVIVGDRLAEFNQISGYSIFRKENIPFRKNNDINYSDFIKTLEVYDSDGNVLTKKERKKIFYELMADKKLLEKGLVAYRKTKSGSVFGFIVGDQLAEFNRVSGYTISDKVKVNDNVAERKSNDIGATEFYKDLRIQRADGTAVVTKQKTKLFIEIINNARLIEKGLVAYRKNNVGQVAGFIVGDRLAEFNQISGYIISEKNDIIQNQPNDIGSSTFVRGYKVCDAEGHIIKNKEKGKIFNKLITDEKLLERGLIAKRKGDNGRVSYYIIGDRLAEFNQISGYVISGKDDIPEKSFRDIGCNDFLMEYQVCDLKGKELLKNQKMAIFDEIVTNNNFLEEGLVAPRKSSNGSVYPVIIGDRLEELQQKTGLVIKSNKEIYSELEAKASKAQTPEEKNKYLTQAKKIFERFNPTVKKQKICSLCLLKIKGEQKSGRK